MSFIWGLLGAFFGIIAVIFFIIFLILIIVRVKFGGNVYRDVKDAFKYAKDLKKQEYARPKDVSGMTKLLEEPILRDFSDFNIDVLFSLIEKNLRKIFTGIENHSAEEIVKDPDLVLMWSKMQDIVEDMKNQDIQIKYDQVAFNRHAIKNYEKKHGKATITTSSSVEYYYKSNVKKDTNYEDVKKQTRYTCEFVYVYDEQKVGYDKEAFGVHCPNCGAPLRRLGAGNCDYCGVHVEPINLKAWKMASYKEDFKN